MGELMQLYRQLQLHQEEITSLKRKVSLLQGCTDVINSIESRLSRLENNHTSPQEFEESRAESSQKCTESRQENAQLEDPEDNANPFTAIREIATSIKAEPEWMSPGTDTSGYADPTTCHVGELSMVSAEASNSTGSTAERNPPNTADVQEGLDQIFKELQPTVVGRMDLGNVEDARLLGERLATDASMLNSLKTTEGGDTDLSNLQNIRGVIVILQDRPLSTDSSSMEQQTTKESVSGASKAAPDTTTKVPCQSTSPKAPKKKPSSVTSSKMNKSSSPSQTKPKITNSKQTKTKCASATSKKKNVHGLVSSKKVPNSSSKSKKKQTVSSSSKATKGHVLPVKKVGKNMIVSAKTEGKKRKAESTKSNVPLKFLKFNQTQLRKHMCDTCGLECEDLAQYTVHIRNHQPIEVRSQPYVCPLCKKIFGGHGKATQFRRHMIYHTGEKRYKCEVCGGAFRRLDAVKTHQKMKHR